MDFGKQLSLVRERAPLVQCITNFVTVNDCANIVLAAGGSPSMADDVREAAEAVRGAAALVCNLGAIAAVDAMLTAMLGAFCGADPDQPFEAACAAIAAMGVAGDLAEERRLKNGTGNATFRTDLIDAVFNLTEEQLNGGVRYEVYEG